jgi:hypothetical protein
MIDEVESRARVADALGKAVNELARRHMRRLTQEPALTAKIGEALEREAEKIAVEGYDVTIVVQDIPDRGPGSLEHESGIDLYVNITVVTAQRTSSKGIIIQAKKETRGRDPGLEEQCEKMWKRSKSAYAWVYGLDGTTIIDAKSLLGERGRPVQTHPHRPPEDLFDAVLECAEGDFAIGLPDGISIDEGLTSVMADLRAGRGAAFVLSKHDGDASRYG